MRLTDSSERRNKLSRRSGLTLVEVLIATTIGVVVVFALVSVTLSTGRSFAEMVNHADIDHFNRLASDHMSRDLRQVRFMTEFSANRIAFVDKDGLPLAFEYSPSAKTLVKTKNGVSTLLMRGCDTLSFAMFQRCPVSNSFDLLPTTAVTNCKVVSVSWKTSRTIMGDAINKHSAEIAQLVVRNKKEE